jgi:hypothetical protein
VVTLPAKTLLASRASAARFFSRSPSHLFENPLAAGFQLTLLMIATRRTLSFRTRPSCGARSCDIRPRLPIWMCVRRFRNPTREELNRIRTCMQPSCPPPSTRAIVIKCFGHLCQRGVSCEPLDSCALLLAIRKCAHKITHSLSLALSLSPAVSRLYGGSMANTSVQTPGVLSSITRGDRPPAATANMCRLPSAGVSAPPSKIASVKPGLAAASFKGSTKPNVSSK